MGRGEEGSKIEEEEVKEEERKKKNQESPGGVSARKAHCVRRVWKDNCHVRVKDGYHLSEKLRRAQYIK